MVDRDRLERLLTQAFTEMTEPETMAYTAMQLVGQHLAELAKEWQSSDVVDASMWLRGTL